MKARLILFLLIITVACVNAQNAVGYVNLLYGTDWGGNVFIGATRPNSILKVGPDCTNNPNSGYDINSKSVKGFSHTHASGTGGAPKYGNVLVQPFTGELDISDYSSPFSNLNPQVGLFQAHLNRYNVDVRISSSSKAAIHEYTYSSSDAAGVLIDAGHFLTTNPVYDETQYLVGSLIEILSPTTIRGYNRVRNGWNMGDTYTVYFYGEFDTSSISSGVWENNQLIPNTQIAVDNGGSSGAWFNFGHINKIKLKVGISYISEAKATYNLEQEINHWDIDRTVSESVGEWSKTLNRIQIKTGNNDYKKMFYTALYHNYLMPVDKTGENPKWTSDQPYFDDFYTIWDTFRTTNPLLTILSPSLQVKFLQSLLDIYKYEKYAPDARSGDCNGRTQGGSNSDILFADAFVKGLQGIDYNIALEAMVKNAEVSPGGDERKEGRGGLNDYNTIGYVSTDYERSVTRTFEYAACDYAIATLAKSLNRNDLFTKYLQRSTNWTNLWRDWESYGVRGFAAPRNRDGSWIDNFDPMQSGSWPDPYYESHSWELSLYVPHNVKGLIEKCGGKEEFEKRLDLFFTQSKQNSDSWVSDFFNVNNEPGFLSPCLYHWIGKPEKSNAISREIVKKHFRAGTNALPGNDDSGAMSAFLAFHLMGFFPLSGQDCYLIMAPHFNELTIRTEAGKTITMRANNLTTENCYIQSVKINGKPYLKSWFTHDIFLDDTIIEFDMKKKPANWASGVLPPSYSSSSSFR